MASSLLSSYPDTLERLRTMDEWLAFGFYEAADLPWPQPYGRAFLRLYENMSIRIPEVGCLVPAEPFPVLRLPFTPKGHWDILGAICDFHYMVGLRANQNAAEMKKGQFPEQTDFIQALVVDLGSQFRCFGDSTHSCPDIQRVVSEGFDAMEQELTEEWERVNAPGSSARDDEKHLLAALREYARGVRAFHARSVTSLAEAISTAVEPRLSELHVIHDSFRDCFLRPATTFVQGLLAVHFTWLLDGCDNIGRLDQVLGPLFDRDVANGTLSVAFARQLLDELFHNIERLNGYNLQVGGRTPAGMDGFNALSHELLLACQRNVIARPNVAFRISRDTPDAAVLTAIEALSNGCGRPALYNDDLYIESLLGLHLGLSPEDARDYGFGGCTETMIPGRSNVGCTCFHSEHFPGIDINLAKALEYALHDGFDPVAGYQVGPHTGQLADFADFEAFRAAVKRQIQFVTDVFTASLSTEYRKRFTAGDPKLFRTLFTRDCVARHRSYEAGGARYNWSIVSLIGMANLTDSLAALRDCVFTHQSIPPETLIAALAANFRGYETERQMLLRAPKFGNDDPAVDDLGRSMVEFACRELLAHGHPRGGRYLPGCILFNHWAGDGAYVGATPDGRLAGTMMADSAGPVQGRDTHGPTAMITSVARLPLHLAAGTPVVNIRLQRDMLSTPSGRNACLHLVRSFFTLGGMQLQATVVDSAVLRAAQDNPEAHGDLVVRVGGYSDYFTSLSRELQDGILARTEHGAGT